jgi:hypothetical protein
MRRHYAQTVTLVDGSSNRASKSFQQMSPAPTPIPTTQQQIEPKRLETSPEPILDPAAPIVPVEGGTL